MRIIKWLAAALIAVLALTIGAFAAAESENVYIFRLNECDLPEIEQLLLGTEEVYAPLRTYKTEDFSVIQRLSELDALEYYCLDGPVYLDSLADDKQALIGEYWSSAMVGSGYAAENNITGKGVKIGIIDSGMTYNEAAFSRATLLEGVNFRVSESSEGRHDVTDNVGHGTFVASVIADSTYGIAPEVTILPLKCFEPNSITNYSIISAALCYAADEGCQVVNMSFGGAEDNEALREAVEYAVGKGVILVSSAGNNSLRIWGTDPIQYPAGYNGVIAVGAVDSKKMVTDFSYRNIMVDLTAPGQDVTGLEPAGTYRLWEGTSFSSPMVAAAAALALCADDTLTAAQVEAFMKSTAEDLGAEGRDNEYGSGLLNVGLMLAAIKKDTDNFVMSYADDVLSVSAYLDVPQDSSCTVFLAFYDGDGKFISLEQRTGITAGMCLCNSASPGDAVSCRLISVESTSCVPINQSRER